MSQPAGTPTDSRTPDAVAVPRAGVAPPGYRLPDALRLGHVRLQVSDLARSLDYYGRVLGLRVLSSEGRTATLGASGPEGAPLVELIELPGASPVSPQSTLGLYHFAILLPDRAALGRLVAHLGRSGVRAGASDHLVSEALYLRDPDGLGIEVYADRPRSAWRVANAQLVMASDPLDGDSLLRAAQGQEWDGMPPGTTMGHLHLHVGDIDAATRFYHDALGLDKMVWTYPGALFLAAGGYHHHLGVNTWAGMDAQLPASEQARLLEWRIILPSPADLREVVHSLTSAGHVVTDAAPGFIAADPWGTRVHLMAD
jgi:catechol 2,3-dioxygenase